MKKKKLEKYLSNEVSKFKFKPDFKKIICYRGLSINSESNLEDNYIGPPPKKYLTENRYNNKSEKCLYLIDDNNFIGEEIQETKWLEQKYKINVSDYEIADLSISNDEMNNILKLAFYMAERGITNGGYNIEKELQNRGKTKYLYSQLLSKVFQKYNWDGFYIPGVRGKKGSHYNNIVIFESIVNNWRKWVCGNYYYSK